MKCLQFDILRLFSIGLVFILAAGSSACATEKQATVNKDEAKIAGKQELPPANKPATKKVNKKPVAKNQASKADSSPNNFNRLLNRTTKKNLNPEDDGIHDPRNEATLYLQTPLEAFAHLPKKKLGNKVDWVKAIETKNTATL